jgi:hypothetical protein
VNEIDIDNKLNNYLRIADIINNVFRQKKTLKKARINYTKQICYTAVKIGQLKLEMQEE